MSIIDTIIIFFALWIILLVSMYLYFRWDYHRTRKAFVKRVIESFKKVDAKEFRNECICDPIEWHIQPKPETRNQKPVTSNRNQIINPVNPVILSKI